VHILQIPKMMLVPVILLLCVVGAYAITNNPVSILVMLAFGLAGFVLMENEFPVAPAILGIVLGPMLEQNFFNSMIKADGNFLEFFSRPIAMWLGIVTVAVWAVMAANVLASRLRPARTSPTIPPSSEQL